MHERTPYRKKCLPYVQYVFFLININMRVYKFIRLSASQKNWWTGGLFATSTINISI